MLLLIFMRSITNILLVLALICYVFLPFYEISFVGTRTGLSFTAGTISQALSITNVIIALLPFIACFGAIALNSLKRRWWVLGTIGCILIWLWFYLNTSSMHDIMLLHAPEVTPDNDLGEGFSIIGLGIGYKLSFAITLISLITAMISLLPFKFNETIDKAVDDTFEDGRRHVRQEFKRLENAAHKSHKNKPNTTSHQEPPTTPAPPIQEDREDPSRFMPKQ